MAEDRATANNCPHHKYSRLSWEDACECCKRSEASYTAGQASVLQYLNSAQEEGIYFRPLTDDEQRNLRAIYKKLYRPATLVAPVKP